MFHEFAARASAAPDAESTGTWQDQARLLLARYPNLSETELARLINLYREFSALDTALVLSDDALAPRLDRFTSEHRSEVRPPFRQYAGLLFYMFLTLAAVVWALSVA